MLNHKLTVNRRLANGEIVHVGELATYMNNHDD
jgi:hypothetical protein